MILIFEHQAERTIPYVKDITDGLMAIFHEEKRSENQDTYRFGSSLLRSPKQVFS